MATAYHFLVTIEAENHERAEEVMSERLSHDEDYGFDYTLGWGPTPWKVEIED